VTAIRPNCSFKASPGKTYCEDLGWRSPDEYETAWHTAQGEIAEAAIVQPEPTGAR
jgi:hypothetical protein